MMEMEATTGTPGVHGENPGVTEEESSGVAEPLVDRETA
jgi:hypothetical protein